MTEFGRNAYSLPFEDILLQVQQEQIDAIGLPDIHDSPFDTSYHADEFRPLEVPGVRSVREKGILGFSGWQDGDIVRGTYTIAVAPPASGKYHAEGAAAPRMSLIAGAETRLSHTNLHEVERLPLQTSQFGPDDVAAILRIGFRRVIADAHIYIDERGQQRTVLGQIHAFERALSTTHALAEGRRGVIEGSVREAVFDGNQFSSYPAQRPHVNVEAADGAVFVVELGHYPNATYQSSMPVAGGGQPAIPRPKSGDYIQIAVACTPSGVFSNELTLSVQDAASFHLLRQGDEAMWAALDASSEFTATLKQIRTATTAPALREAIGLFVHERLQRSPASRLDLSKADAATFEAAVQEKAAAFIWRARPALFQSPQFSIETLLEMQQQFDRGVFFMSREQFKAFALEVAAGEQAIAPSQTVVSNAASRFFDLFEGDSRTTTALITTALTEFYAAPDHASQLNGYEGQPTESRHAAMLQRDWCCEALARLPGVGTTDVIKLLHARIPDIFRDVHGTRRLLNKALRPVALVTMQTCLLKCAVWNAEFSVLPHLSPSQLRECFVSAANSPLLQAIGHLLPIVDRAERPAQSNADATAKLRATYSLLRLNTLGNE